MTHNHLMPTYARQNIAFSHGNGVYLYDTTGQAYLDAIAGIAVCGLGHAHPAVTKAISEQAATLIHTSNIFEIPWQSTAGASLCQVSGMDQCFFGNSGAEANEAAIKLARMFAHKQHIANPKIIVMEKSFHGRTLATLSATGNAKVQEGFAPLVDGFIRVAHGDVAAVKAMASQHANIVAVLVEPIQGEGGIHMPHNGFAYLADLQQLCQQHNWLLMVDEIQTGNGRTGKYFAYQHAGITPDVVTTAKGLGNGFPVGACLVAGKATGLFGPGNHGSTYGGSPLACRTVCAVIQTLQNDGVIDNAASNGAYLMQALRDALQGQPVEVRGAGLMIGIELPTPCANLVAEAREQAKLLINVTADKVVRLLPPLIITRAECDDLVARLVPLIKAHIAKTA